MIAAFLIALLLGSSAGQDGPALRSERSAEQSGDAAYEALLAEYEAACAQWREAKSAARDIDARRAARGAHPAKDFFSSFEALAEQGHGQALLWMLENAALAGHRGADAQRIQADLCRRIVREHHDAPWIAAGLDRIVGERRSLGDAELEALLAELIERTGNADVGRAATAILARILAESDDPERREKGYALYEKVLRDSPDDRATGELRAEYARLKHLRIGMVAPDFAAETVDGVAFKLSDFRGKVVVVDFWGLWCPPCRAELPHLKALAEKHAGKPFAIVGVDTDWDKDSFRKQAAELGVTWINAWQGSPGGPIPTAWGVVAFPTTYVLDAEGRVRHANLRGAELGEAVERLLAGMPAPR